MDVDRVWKVQGHHAREFAALRTILETAERWSAKAQGHIDDLVSRLEKLPRPKRAQLIEEIDEVAAEEITDTSEEITTDDVTADDKAENVEEK